MGSAGEPIPISALQHAVYCLRQAALIHLERLWAENRFTAEGDVLHAVAAQWPAAKRLIVSGHSDLEVLHDATRTGLAAQLFPKPWNKAELLATVRRLLT